MAVSSKPCPPFVSMHALAGGIFALLASPLSWSADDQANPLAAAVLPEVRITAGRIAQKQFDAPASVHALDASALDWARPQVNLTEVLTFVPGLMSANRHNYAQDVQISIRGFGARAAFGLRGIRLIADGIPATTPDGQGQASTVSLTSADQVVVTTGPLAQLYGNSAGGVIQVQTRQPTDTPQGQIQSLWGSYGLQRTDWQASGRSGAVGMVADLSTFATDGYRANSAAKRTHFNGVLTWDVQPGTRIKLVINAFDMPQALDPLGLSRAQFDQDPSQAGSHALADRARKTVRQEQGGLLLEQRLAGGLRLQTRLYAGHRDTQQFQARTSGSNGSWIGLSRDYAGAGLQLGAQRGLAPDVSLDWTVGLELDRSAERRQGGLSNAGQIIGGLNRDEVNTAQSRDLFAQVNWHLGASWTLTGGLRRSQVDFSSRDAYFDDGKDGSGAMRFGAFSPVLGATWHASDQFKVFANWGQGFETPTLAEVAYRNVAGSPVGQGLNAALRASHSKHSELGLKWQPDKQTQGQAALFRIRTDDEIVSDVSAGGKTAFRNATRTSRDGLELSARSVLHRQWLLQASATLMLARYVDAAGPIAAGNRMPSLPKRQWSASARWARDGHGAGARAPTGPELSAQWVARSSLYANDANTAVAGAYGLLDLQARQRLRWGAAELMFYAGLNNASDRRYVSSVISNQAAGRYFESGLPRHWLAGVQAVLPL
jgi:iron complex outermembrane receptor protein